jgi:hypothetical protein
MTTSLRPAHQEDHPTYTTRADFGRRPAAPQQFRCNVCNHTCPSNEALMAHYRNSHVQEFARLQALTAQLGLPTKPPRGA